jgi:hypothetical protein
MKNGERPTGIIRTLPGEAKSYALDSFARGRMMRSYDALSEGKIPAIYVALAQRPKVDVLHLYILVGGQIVCRMNIAGYESGKGWTLDCWDGVNRVSPWWVLCSAPVSYPPEPIKMRGFQGFRYTQELW